MTASLLPIIIHLATSIAGATSTYLLQSKKMVNKVQSSALTTLLFSISIYLLKSYLPANINSSFLMSLFWGASFIAMSSPKVVNWRVIVIASILLVLTIKLTIHLYPTFGGKLGILAAICSLASLAINWIMTKMVNFIQKLLSSSTR